MLLASLYLLSRKNKKRNPKDLTPSMALMLHHDLTLDEVDELRAEPLFVDEGTIIESMKMLPRYYMGKDEFGESYYLVNMTPHSMNFVRKNSSLQNPRDTSIEMSKFTREYVQDNFVYVQQRPTRPAGIPKKSWLSKYPEPFFTISPVSRDDNKKPIVVDGIVFDYQTRKELGLLNLPQLEPPRSKTGFEYVDVHASGLYIGNRTEDFPPNRFPTISGQGLNLKMPKKPISYIYFQDPLHRGDKRKSDFYAYGKFPNPETIEREFPNTYFVTSRIAECLEPGITYPFIFPGDGKSDFVEKDGKKYTKKFYFADMICEVLR